MLQELREKAKSTVAYVIIGVLILSFGLWGISSYFRGGAGKQVVAEVGGEEISHQQFETVFNQYQRIQQMNLGANYSNQSAFQNALRQQLLASMISRMALLQYLLREDFRVGMEQVEQAVFALPEFQDEGAFSPEKYKHYLRSAGLTDEGFLLQFQKNLLIDQLHQGVFATNFALPNEIEQTASIVQQKRQIQYAVIEANLPEAASITKQDIDAYYQKHKAQFQLPESVKIAYILLSPKDFHVNAEVSDSVLKAYYQTHSNEFLTSDTSQISTLSNNDFQRLQSKIKQAYLASMAKKQYEVALETLTNVTYEQPESLMPAAKVLKVAVQTSQYFSHAGGKDAITKNQQIIAAAFSDDVLKEGNNSVVIALPHDQSVVLRVSGHHAGKIQPLKEVQPTIIKQLQKAKQAAHSQQLATSIQEAVKQGQSFADVVREKGLALKTSPYVGRFSKVVDSDMILDAFHQPASSSDKRVYITPIANGEKAVYVITGVKPGKTKHLNKTTIESYQQQIINSWANLEYTALLNHIHEESQVKLYGKNS